MNAGPSFLTQSASSSSETARSSRLLSTVIDASAPASRLSFRELAQYVDLMLILAARDLAVRYRQALIGVAWAVIRPAASVTMFVTLFGLLQREPATSGVPYAATALVGLLTWQLFSTTLSDMSDSLVKNRQMLTKVYFPHVVLPISATAVGLTDYLVALVPALGCLWAWGIRPTWATLTFPLWLLGVLACAATLGCLFSALNARYRDVGHALPFLLQLGFFASPVIYETAAIIPEPYRAIYRLNPLAVMLDGLRWSLLGTELPAGGSLVLAVVVVATGLVASWWTFERLSYHLVDRI